MIKDPFLCFPYTTRNPQEVPISGERGEVNSCLMSNSGHSCCTHFILRELPKLMRKSLWNPAASCEHSPYSQRIDEAIGSLPNATLKTCHRHIWRSDVSLHGDSPRNFAVTSTKPLGPTFKNTLREPSKSGDARYHAVGTHKRFSGTLGKTSCGNVLWIPPNTLRWPFKYIAGTFKTRAAPVNPKMGKEGEKLRKLTWGGGGQTLHFSNPHGGPEPPWTRGDEKGELIFSPRRGKWEWLRSCIIPVRLSGVSDPRTTREPGA